MYNGFGTGFNYNNGIYPASNANMYQPINAPRMEIIKVNGRNGAESLQIAPNSSALLLDTTASIVWFVQTDGAGYKTVTPYAISPYQPEPTVDVNSLELRIKKLEDMLSAKSNNGANEQE